MTYEVWAAKAENQLAVAWTAAADRNAVTDAAARLDRVLMREPLKVGESRSSSVHRVAYDHPLGVEFEVIEDDKRVIVQGVFAIS